MPRRVYAASRAQHRPTLSRENTDFVKSTDVQNAHVFMHTCAKCPITATARQVTRSPGCLECSVRWKSNCLVTTLRYRGVPERGSGSTSRGLYWPAWASASLMAVRRGCRRQVHAPRPLISRSTTSSRSSPVFGTIGGPIHAAANRANSGRLSRTACGERPTLRP